MKTRTTRNLLAGLYYTGLDRLYQQLDRELGMLLTFHHVNPNRIQAFAPNAHLAVHPDFLAEVIAMIRRRGVELITMDEVRSRIVNPRPGRRFAAITFDDGYRDNLQHAVPVLKRLDVPFTIYIASAMIDGTASLWWEGVGALVRDNHTIETQMNGTTVVLDCSNPSCKQAAFVKLMRYLTEVLPESLQRDFVKDLCERYGFDLQAHCRAELLNWSEIKQLADDPLCTVGSHTVNHPALARLDEQAALREMVEGAQALHERLGTQPAHFAYPYGYRQAAGPREFELAQQAGFATAVTTRPGMVFPQHASFLTSLPRISVNGLYQKMRYFAPLTSGLPTRLKSRLHRMDIA